MGDAWGVTPVRRLSILLALVGALALPAAAAGQSLDLHTSGGFGSGLSLASVGGGTNVAHTPTFFHLDIAGVIDGDAAWEYAGALSVPFETAPGLVVTPRLRRVRERWGLHTFLGLGAPLHIAPATLAGVEVSMGAWYDLYDELQVGGEINADVFVAGDDLPEEGSLVMFNVVAGARVPL